jgi:hypothetical protein
VPASISGESRGDLPIATAHASDESRKASLIATSRRPMSQRLARQLQFALATLTRNSLRDVPLFTLGRFSPFGHTPLEIIKVMVHLLERESDRKEPFRRVA